MLTAEQAIVDEVEAAIRAGSAEKCIATAKRVTDLFLTSAGSFNSEQVELFDNVLERLVKTIELRRLPTSAPGWRLPRSASSSHR